MRTAEVLDKETGITIRHLWIDAKEMVANDPARYQIASAPQKSLVKTVTDGRAGSATVGRLEFEPL